MSQRNGDRSRFGNQRKQKMVRRKRNRALRERLGATVPAAAPKTQRGTGTQ